MSAIWLVVLCATSRPTWADQSAWTPAASNHVSLSIDGITTTIETTGRDPFVVWDLQLPMQADQRVLEFEYFATDRIEAVSGLLGPPFSEAGRFGLPDLTIAEGWQTYAVDLVAVSGKPISDRTKQLRIDFGLKPQVRIQLRGMRLRPLSEREVRDAQQADARRAAKIRQSQTIADYLDASFPATFTDVEVDERYVTLTTSALETLSDHDRIRLVEFPPHMPIGTDGLRCEASWRLSVRGGEPKSKEWLMGETGCTADGVCVMKRAPLSRRDIFRRSSTLLETPSPDAPAVRRGLTGISTRGPLDELPKLGIQAVTLNLVLNRFVTLHPGQGRERIDVPGPAVYFDTQAFQHYDRLMDFARRHQITVTAIVLIPCAKRGLASPLVHPESDGGVYAMPDLTSERGVGLYTQVLDKIAQRYRDSEKSPGGITNWIAHNEIDFHPVWTNMGSQPAEIVTETYYRSMRIIHNIARAHNAGARVFASLTHHWNVRDLKSWKQLSPRDVLESLQRYSLLEGDFAWGVAYHPYPQSLFAPVAWNDTNIRDNFDTPLITIQNLEVLGRFLDQPTMRDASGQMRPVLLSEQGFHTDGYTPEAQARQAGSLWYTMKKIRTLPWIETFHYHRWIDHPEEGGLMLGLRTLPTEEHPHGRRKRSWYVYEAIGTENEIEVTRGLPQP